MRQYNAGILITRHKYIIVRYVLRRSYMNTFTLTLLVAYELKMTVPFHALHEA